MGTCIIKALTLPLTTQQLESTTKMQKLQPLQQKIQAKYARPEQEQTKNQLLAQLFQAANVNPLAGCFPALVQIPVFLSLYRALQNLVAENKLDEPFLWIPDLEGPVYMKPPGESLDWVKSIFSGTPDLGWDDTLAFLTVPAILFVSQTISTKIMQPPKDPNRVLTDQELTSQGIINNILTTVITQIVKANLKDEPMPMEVEKMMAAIEADTGSAGAAVKSRVSGAQAELGRGMGTRMSDEDRERLERFERMQSKGGFGAGGGATSSDMPVVDVTPVEVDEAASSVATNTAKEIEEPKGPIGKTLKFINENASELEEQIEADNLQVVAQERAMTEEINEKLSQKKTSPGEKRNKRGKKQRKK